MSRSVLRALLVGFICFSVACDINPVQPVAVDAVPPAPALSQAPLLPGETDHWDLTEDFSDLANPNGAWSAGWKATLDGPLTLYSAVTTYAGRLRIWVDPQLDPGYAGGGFTNWLMFGKNIASDAHPGIGAGQVFLHPACVGGRMSVVRWTAPSTGTYRVGAQFQVGAAGVTSAHVVLNDNAASPVYFVPNTSSNAIYSGTHSLVTGDLLDFVVSVSGDCASDATPIEIVISRMWDITTDFSDVDNPSSAWIGGWQPTLGGPFTSYTGITTYATRLRIWADPVMDPGYAWGSFSHWLMFGKNVAGDAHPGIGPGEVFLHPGCGGNEYSVLRWTAPSSGTYQVAAQFHAGAGGTTSASIIRNDLAATPLFAIGSTNANPWYDQDQVLADGDRLDFAVGTAGDCSSDATPIAVTVSRNDPPRPQQIVFTSPPPSAASYGGNHSVSALGGGSGSAVTFSSLTPAVCTVSATLVTFVGVGTCSVAADQAGSLRYAPASQVIQTFQVNKAPQAVSFTSSPSNPRYLGTYAPTVTPGPASTPVVIASMTPAVCIYQSTTADVAFTGVGTCTLTANQAGDDFHLAASEATQTFQVNKALQTITITQPSSTLAYAGTTAPLEATSTSELVVSWSTTTPATCIPGINSVTQMPEVRYVAVGSCELIAQQTGDALYEPTVLQRWMTVQYEVQFLTPIQPVPFLNTAKAGEEVSVRFDIHGDFGIGILSGALIMAPSSGCDGAPSGPEALASTISLTYNKARMHYVASFGSEKTWKGTCQLFYFDFSDGTRHAMLFSFTK